MLEGLPYEKSKTYYFLDCSPWYYFAVVFQSCHSRVVSDVRTVLSKKCTLLPDLTSAIKKSGTSSWLGHSSFNIS